MSHYQTHSQIQTATSITAIRAGLATLHSRENDIIFKLNTILTSQKDPSRELMILDSLRVNLGTQLISTRNIRSTILGSRPDTADRLSTRVRELDTEKKRVEETLRVVEQVAELKACVAGVVGSMGAPQDWEAAAHYLSRASKIPEDIVRGGFAAAVVPTIEAPGPPWDTLESARASLCALFLREFSSAAKERDSTKVTRFFKLFPLINRSEIGLDAYGRYIRQDVAHAARETLRKRTPGVGPQDVFFYVNAFSKLFEHIAQIVDSHNGLVRQHYSEGQMVKVVEILQIEADIHGGIILDSWTDSRSVDRMMTDAKSYPFSFLAQSILTHRQGETGSMKTYDVAALSDTDGTNVDMRETDWLLTEMVVMLERWLLYCQFVARQCQETDTPDGATLTVPGFLLKSDLNRRVSKKLSTPCSMMMVFFLRRSVEKAFQTNHIPTGLSLSKPTNGHPPFIMQAIDDIMYMVDAVLQKALSTSNPEVTLSVIPAIGHVLESDLVGIIHRRMQDECYPRSHIQGNLPPEDKIINFLVMINSLDVSKEYLDRLCAQSGLEGVGQQLPPESSSLKDRFPFNHNAEHVTHALDLMNKAFSSKATVLLNEGIQALFDEVVRLRLRPVLANTFQDVDYEYSGDELVELTQQDDEDITPRQKFEEGWNALMKPLQRIMTPKTYLALLTLTTKFLARLLEQRLWSCSDRVSALGAIRMELDFCGIIDAISEENYAVREMYMRIQQILAIANMDESEWIEATVEGSEYSITLDWVLFEDEKKRARGIVKS